MRPIVLLALALAIVPAAQAAFAEQHADEAYTERTLDINAAQGSITVRRHFTVNQTEPGYVWFDTWTADAVAAGYKVAYALGPADGQGGLASVLLAQSDVRNTDASRPVTLTAGTQYVLQFIVTYPPTSQRAAATHSFVGIVALQEGQGTEGSGGVLDPSIGTRLDVTFTGTVTSPTPTPPRPTPTPQPPAPTPTPAPPPEPQVIPPPTIVTKEFYVPWWLVALLIVLLLIPLVGLARRRRKEDHSPAAPRFAVQEGGPFLLRDDPFWDVGPPKRL